LSGYAQHLPVGCMLGYVLDGDVSFGQERLAGTIGGHAPLELIDGRAPLASVETIERFRTRHTCTVGSEIELGHA
jgi:hypothetical protein